MKKFLPIAMVSLFFLSSLAWAASVNREEDFTPENAVVTFDFTLSGKLKKLVSPLLDNIFEKDSVKEKDIPKIQVLIDQLRAGKRFFVSYTNPNIILISFPVSDSQWETVIEGSTELSPGIYTDSQSAYTRIGSYAVLSLTGDSLAAATELAEGKSTKNLTNSPGYTLATKDYLSPRWLSATLNIQELIKTLQEQLGGETNEFSAAADALLGYINYEGFSVGETNSGYAFNIKATADAGKMRAKGMSFNPGGNFTPSLYQKFPNAKPILYFEAYNPKAGYEQSKKIISQLKEVLGGEDVDIYAELEKETGINFGELYGIFEKEFAFGIQSDFASPLPFITIMGDASNHREAAQKIVKDLVKLITNLFKEARLGKKVYSVENLGDFTKITLKVEKIKDYDGPPFPDIVITFGVTADGLFVVSNYPGIEDAAKRTGFGGDADFSAYPQIKQPSAGISYISPRNLWGWFDALASWGERAGGGRNGPPLDFYQGYYSTLDAVYSWKDLFIVNTATETEAAVNGFITVDTVKHKSYNDLLDELRSSDRDSDGVSDYDERYVYNTSPDAAEDFDALKKGYDPRSGEKIFSDISEDSYYTDEVSYLRQQGSISGYSDGSFQPGRLVNRAEFITMIVKTFEEGTSKFLGVNVELKSGYHPFTDVDRFAWYNANIEKAYAAGFVSGSVDPETGESTLRPGDNITRAEALTILNKASDSLRSTRNKNHDCEGAFGDVKSDDWFCSAVANGYANGITKGKSANSFGPHDSLTRADAAVMIRRTLEKDLEFAASGTREFGDLTEDLTAPLGKKLLPAASGLLNKESAPPPIEFDE